MGTMTSGTVPRATRGHRRLSSRRRSGRARGPSVSHLPRWLRRAPAPGPGCGAERVTIGRRPSADVALESDEEVSRLHAELVRKGEDWTLADEGLSMNGSFVNGEPVRGQRRLRDGDAIRVGGTVLIFRNPRTTSQRPRHPRMSCDHREPVGRTAPRACGPVSAVQRVRGIRNTTKQRTDRRRAVPERGRGEEAPAHPVPEVRRLPLPQNEKRARLVERAFAGGFISDQGLLGAVHPGGLLRHLAGPSGP